MSVLTSLAVVIHRLFRIEPHVGCHSLQSIQMSQVEYLEGGVRIKKNEEGQSQEDCQSMLNSLKLISESVYMKTKGKKQIEA